MMKEMEVDMRTPSPMIMSPTGLTNAVRRDKSTSPDRKETTTFLAAEQFQEMAGSPYGRSRSDESSKRSGQQYQMPFVDEVSIDKGSFEGCRALLMRRPKNCTEVKDVAFEVKEVAMSAPVQTAVKEQYVKPAQLKAKVFMVKAREKVGKAAEKTKEMKPDEDQVRGCMRETRATGDTVAKYANIVYDMLAQECVPNAARGDQRGDDAMFFRYGTPSSGESPEMTSKRRSLSPLSSESTSDHAFRSPKSMRYPQAADIENPMERSERKKNRERDSRNRRRDSSEETREDNSDSFDQESIDLIMNKGEDQASLREVRLQMYKFDDGEKHVPRARLSRALGELSTQDKMIDSLQEELEGTKVLLEEKESRLAETEALCRKHERKIQELMEKASEDKRTLEIRIAREAQAKGKLQSRIDVLQKEIHRLRAIIGESNDTSTMSSTAREQLKRADSEETGTDGEVWEGILSDFDDNATAEVSLRAEIISLKSQIADTMAETSSGKSTSSSHKSKSSRKSKSSSSSRKSKSTASRNLPTRSEPPAEADQLRQKLKAVEAELASLRESKHHGNVAHDRLATAQQELDTAEEELLACNTQLEEARAIEAKLRKELEGAKKRIEALENERAASNMDSLEEAEDLKLLYKENNKESEVEKNLALEELDQSRKEVNELRAQVKCMTEKIHELSQNAVALTEERLEERERLEEALHRCKDTEHQLRDQIADLEQRLEKAQTSTNQLAYVSEGADESRSVKRKLDESFDAESGALVTRESFQVEEKEELKEQLRKRQATEEHLRAEIAITRELLHCAEKVVVEMETEMKEETRLRSDNEVRLVKELNDLRKKLEENERKNRETVAARAKDTEEHSQKDRMLKESEEKQQALLKQIHVLRTALESVEKEKEHEKMEMVEERRIHDDLESKRIKEIDSLRVELANVRAKAEKSSALEAEVNDLRVRLADAKIQSVEIQKSSMKEGQKKDEMSKKLRTEISTVKQRLATIRKRNATRRQREARRLAEMRKDDSTTDDVSSSGESEQSYGFSNPANFSSPERGTATTSAMSSHSTATGLSPSLRSSSWSSPQRPLGSFPSPPRERVDVSSLRRRLVESNQRLQDANSRLSGLEENLGDEIMTLAEQHSDSTPISPDRPLRQRQKVTIVEKKQHPSVRWPEFEEYDVGSI